MVVLLKSHLRKKHKGNVWTLYQYIPYVCVFSGKTSKQTKANHSQGFLTIFKVNT